MNPSSEYPGHPVSTKQLRDQSPAAGLANRMEARTSQLYGLVEKLDQIHARLYGPRPETPGEVGKIPPPMGFFDALERVANNQESLLDQRADTILEALTL